MADNHTRYAKPQNGIPHPAPHAVRIGGAATALGKTRAEIDAFLDAIPQEV